MHAIELEGLTKDYGNGRGVFDLELDIDGAKSSVFSAPTAPERPPPSVCCWP
jgi:hypothetical protein